MAALNDVYQLITYCWQSPQLGLNITHWKVTGIVTTGATDVELADHMQVTFAARYAAYLPTVATFLGCEVQKISPVPTGGRARSTQSVSPGTQPTEPLPTQTALLISRRTALGGARYRGRIYLPFWTEVFNDAAAQPTLAAQVLAGFISAQYLLLQVAAGAGGGTVSLQPGIWSPTFNTFQEVTSHVLRTNWATIRRRSKIGPSDTNPF